MVFNKSDALLEEYRKIGEVYEDTEQEKYYAFVLKQIASDPNKRETIHSMTRIKVAEDEEYITYIHSWEGRNPIGSFLRVTQTDVGTYPRFEPIYEKFIREDNTYGQKLISKNTTIGYFIPFTKERADELHKLCDDKSFKSQNKTKYYVQPEGGTPITVNTYQDWVNGSFEDIYEHGKISNAIAPTTTTSYKGDKQK